MTDADTRQSILLVDDDQFLLDLYARKFEMNGFAAVRAGSAIEALEKLRGGLTPVAIVFDIIMPEMDGYGFLTALKKDNIAPDAIKIALSNETEDGGVDRARELGADGYIAKASSVPSETVESVIKVMSDLRDAKK